MGERQNFIKKPQTVGDRIPQRNSLETITYRGSKGFSLYPLWDFTTASSEETNRKK